MAWLEVQLSSRKHTRSDRRSVRPCFMDWLLGGRECVVALSSGSDFARLVTDRGALDAESSVVPGACEALGFADEVGAEAAFAFTTLPLVS